MLIRIFAFILLFILSPIFLILALVTLIEDGLPVFFTQKRVGINVSFFKIYKFRSMKRNSPNVVKKIMLVLALFIIYAIRLPKTILVIIKQILR